jgi:hypothetical protein
MVKHPRNNKPLLIRVDAIIHFLMATANIDLVDIIDHADQVMHFLKICQLIDRPFMIMVDSDQLKSIFADNINYL